MIILGFLSWIKCLIGQQGEDSIISQKVTWGTINLYHPVGPKEYQFYLLVWDIHIQENALSAMPQQPFNVSCCQYLRMWSKIQWRYLWMISRWWETHLNHVLNTQSRCLNDCGNQSCSKFEECHFMVKDDILLCHNILEKGIQVDLAKVEAIAKQPPLVSVKCVWSFLTYVGFYRRFIKDFSKIANTLCKILEKQTKFNFNYAFLKSFVNFRSYLFWPLYLWHWIGHPLQR